MGRVVSTISDEVKRNSVRGAYDPRKAAHKAYVRRKYAKYQGMRIVERDELRTFVERGLKEGRSPESIAKRVNRQEKHLPSISGDSIERFLKSVYGRKIESERKALKQKRRWRRRRAKSARLRNRKFIDVRPQIANQRGRMGDAEGDFIESGRGGEGRLLVVVDRKLRVVFVEKVWPVSMANITRAFQRMRTRYPEMRTLTADNDIMLDHHAELEKLLCITIFFCHPYHSWEKGTVENANGEIRKYIPKGSDISKRSRRFIRFVETKLNDRYMDCLDSRTPAEALTLHRKNKTR